MAIQINKDFWKGTNFYVALFMLIAGIFTGYTTETGNILTSAILGIAAAVMAIRKLLVTEIDIKAWVRSKNTQNYLVTLLTMIFGSEIAQVVPVLQQLIEAFAASNLQGIIAAVLSLATMLYYIFQKKQLDLTVEVQDSTKYVFS
jgi:ABC-type enterochelin transport system permease subunit